MKEIRCVGHGKSRENLSSSRSVRCVFRDDLGAAERFQWDTMQVPRFDRKLEVFVLHMSFPELAEQVFTPFFRPMHSSRKVIAQFLIFRIKKSQVQERVDVVLSTIDTVLGSDNFKTVLRIVLNIGNVLNRGRSKGNAMGSAAVSLCVVCLGIMFSELICVREKDSNSTFYPSCGKLRVQIRRWI